MEIDKIKIEIIKDKAFQVLQNEPIKSPKDIIKFINNVEDIEFSVIEIAYIINLNTKNKIINYLQVGQGTTNTCEFNQKLILQSALLSNASKCILIHNHPSGNCTPSEIDIQATFKLKKILQEIDVSLIDSVIIGDKKAFSIIGDCDIEL